MSWLLRRLYRWKLRAYPRAFRARYGDEMETVFEENWRDLVHAGGGTRLGRARRAVLLTVKEILEVPGSVRRARRTAREEVRQKRPFGGGAAPGSGPRGGHGGVAVDAWLADLRHAVRLLVRSPRYALAVVLTLGAGFGANTTVFSLVDGLLLAPLPYPEAGRIVRLEETRPNMWSTLSPGQLTLSSFTRWRAATRMLGQMAIYAGRSVTLTGVDEPVRLAGAMVSPALFPLLGAEPLYGRTFSEAEEREGSGDVVILSEGTWKRLFAGDTNVLGTTAILDEQPHVVIGVMPSSFDFPRPDVDFWVPFTLAAPTTGGPARSTFDLWIEAVARLGPGVSIEQAEAEANALMREAYGTGDARERTVHLVPLGSRAAERVRPALLMLAGAVGFVLVIACANVAGLALARSAARSRDTAIRAALGAGRRRIVRPILLESTLLALMAAPVGLLLAAWSLRWLRAFGAELTPHLNRVSLDLRVLAVTAAVSLGVGLLSGLAPAAGSARLDIERCLRGGGPSLGRWRASSGAALRRPLAVVAVALAIVLLAGAGLLMNSFVRLVRLDYGYDPDHLLTLQLHLPDSTYREDAERLRLLDGLVEAARRLPEVIEASAASALPSFDATTHVSVTVDGSPRDTGDPVELRIVDPAYFPTVGLRRLAGRLPDPGMPADGDPVVVLNESAARLLVGREDPVGARVSFLRYRRAEVIGLVADTARAGTGTDAEPEAYVLYSQMPSSMARSLLRTPRLILRTVGNPLALTGNLRDLVARADPNIAVSGLLSLRSRLDSTIAAPRMYALIVTAFAGFATLLATLGVYAIVAHAVVRRTHELGVRRALGAGRRSLLTTVLAEGLRLAAVGLLVGLPGAWVLSGFLRGLLYGVKPGDPATFGAVGLLCAAVMLAASWLPARRALRVDPVEALRAE